MRILIIILLTFIITFQSISQNYLQEYYPTINKAELSIIDKQYEIALKYYQESFNNVRGGFLNDFKNAIICASFLNEEKIILQYFDSLLVRGESPSYLETNVFSKYNKKRKWRKILEAKTKNIDKYHKAINKEYRIELEKMLETDQESRKTGEKVYETDIENAQKLKKLIDMYGFPSEKIVGIKSLKLNFEYKYPYHILLLHYMRLCKTYDDLYSFRETIKQAIKVGKIDIHLGSFLLDQELGNDYYFSAMFFNIKGWYIPDFSEKDKESINQRRKELGLESIDDYIKKMTFDTEGNSDFYFTLTGYRLFTDWETAYKYYLKFKKVNIE